MINKSVRVASETKVKYIINLNEIILQIQITLLIRMTSLHWIFVNKLHDKCLHLATKLINLKYEFFLMFMNMQYVY